MDKLKPLIVHKFWIILFIALLLPVVGWSMATGNLAKEIEDRTKAIDTAFTSAQLGPNPPNQTWASALADINKNKEKYIGQSNKELWEKQKEQFIWPPNIQPLMKNAPYRGEISRVPRNLYRNAYKFEILRIHKLANPFSLRDGTGTIDISPNVIPHVPLSKWKTLPPSSEEMWDAQEDVWIATSIIEKIAEINKNSKNINESPIRQISVLEFRGGTAGGAEDENMGGEGMGMDPEMDAAMGGPGGAFGPGFGAAPAAGGDAMGGKKNIVVDLDLTEIFGNDIDMSAASGDEMDGEPMEAAGGAFAPGMGMGMGMGMGGSQKLKRYYHDSEELPYKTRAFYIKAIIEPPRLPKLLSALTQMPWPVEIMRVQRVDMFDDNLNPIAGAGGGMQRQRPGAAMGREADSFGIDGEFGEPGAGAGRPGFGFDAEAGGIPGLGGQQGLGNKGLLDAALNDPQLAVVTIAGLVTLYKPYPPVGENGDLADGTTGNSGQPVPEAAAMPTDPLTTSESATPAENTTNATNSTKPPTEKPENNPTTPPEEKPKQPPESPPAGSKPAGSQPPAVKPAKTEAAAGKK